MIEIKELSRNEIAGKCIEGLNRLFVALAQGQTPHRINIEDLVDTVRNPLFYIFVAYDADKEYPENFAGMASILFQRTLTHWIGELHDIAVEPSYHGRGLGFSLLLKQVQKAEELVRNTKMTVVLSLTSRPSRKSANKLYPKLGFVRVARAYGKEGTNLYRKVIRP